MEKKQRTISALHVSRSTTSLLCLAVCVSFLVLVVPALATSRAIHNVPSVVAPDDTTSADAILAALYDVISGPAGQKRNWDRMRSLFLPSGKLIGTGRRPDGMYGHRSMTVEDYITANAKFLEDGGFFEKEIGRHTDTYGNILQVFSAYETRRVASDPKPFMRGINSIQLWNDGKRWWIVNVFWQSENPQQPLPEQYLKKE
ncbi:MAG TPA: hypothetical protein VII11_03205 [Bacteroidota bacterium]